MEVTAEQRERTRGPSTEGEGKGAQARPLGACKEEEGAAPLGQEPACGMLTGRQAAEGLGAQIRNSGTVWCMEGAWAFRMESGEDSSVA